MRLPVFEICIRGL